MNKRDLGNLGEKIAEAYLLECGFTTIEKNYYTKFGEIDLICSKNKILYFVEVKYRRSSQYGSPKEALTPKKIQCFKRAVLTYMKNEVRTFEPFKMAFVGIVATKDLKIEFIEDIFA